MSVSVVLPTYNEAMNIVPLVHAIVQALGESGLEILVVDDDSPDGTWREAEKLEQAGEPVRVVRRTSNRGLTASLNEGITAARGDVVCWMDADFSMPPAALCDLVDEASRGTDLAVGSRYVPGGSDGRDNVPVHRFLSRVITWAATRLLVPGFRDYTSGFVAVRRQAMMSLAPLRGDYGEYFIDLIYRAHRRGLSIRELPYRCNPRRAGESKTASSVWGFARRGIGYIRTVMRLFWQGER